MRLEDIKPFKVKITDGKITEEVEFAPVKHGTWIVTPYTDYDDAWECSACGMLWTFNGGTPQDLDADYCPHCGARMDKEKDDEAD